MENYDITSLLSDIGRISQEIVRLCSENGKMLATAESCTGGMLSAAITAVPGSSAVIELGVCSYSNRIKNKLLGVENSILEQYTEYSVQCAKAMANGVMNAAGSDYGVSTTGIAGPSGGTAEHPVGEVCIGISTKTTSYAKRYVFKQESSGSSGRELIRAAAARQALLDLKDAIKKEISTER